VRGVALHRTPAGEDPHNARDCRRAGGFGNAAGMGPDSRRKSMMARLIVMALALAVGMPHASKAAAPAAARPDSARIEALTGAKGVYVPSENVFKVSAPRNDLEVRAA